MHGGHGSGGGCWRQRAGNVAWLNQPWQQCQQRQCQRESQVEVVLHETKPWTLAHACTHASRHLPRPHLQRYYCICGVVHSLERLKGEGGRFERDPRVRRQRLGVWLWHWRRTATLWPSLPFGGPLGPTAALATAATTAAITDAAGADPGTCRLCRPRAQVQDPLASVWFASQRETRCRAPLVPPLHTAPALATTTTSTTATASSFASAAAAAAALSPGHDSCCVSQRPHRPAPR